MGLYLPARPTPWFSFVVHPRSVADLRREGGSEFLYRKSSGRRDFLEKVRGLPPLVIGEVTFGFAPIRGEIVAAMRMPELMRGCDGQRYAAEAVALAVERGSAVIGLGALTAPLTGGGRRLERTLPANVTLTSGNAFTAAVLRENVREAIRLRHAGASSVAILGSTGSVGFALAQLLHEDGLDLVLIGRSPERARALLHSRVGEAVYSGSPGDVARAPVAVLLTNDPTARLVPGHARPGMTIIDAAQPPNIARARWGVFEEIGCSVAEGAVVEIPGYHCSYDFELNAPRGCFACLAETFLFAREGIREHSTGRASADLARWLWEVAGRHRVRPLPLFGADEVLKLSPAG